MPEHSKSSAIGQVIGDRYEIVGVIGRGGQGMVCRAKDRESGDIVAVKIMSDADPQTRKRFEREQQALLALAGTNVVRVYDMLQGDAGALYLVMELLDGRDLEAVLHESETQRNLLSQQQIAEIMGPIVDTLEKAHSKGILHRDLKPANIFLLRDGGVRLLDFGFARLRASAPLTAAGMVMGSPSYIAPEVWRGSSQGIDHRVDVYAIGVLLYRMLAGRLPFASESLSDMLVLATTAERPGIKQFRPDLPEEIDLWAKQALAVDPDERFRTARATYNALFAVLEQPPEAAADRQSSRPSRPSQVPAKIANKLSSAIQSAAAVVKRWTKSDDAAGAAPKTATPVPPAPEPLPAVAPPAPEARPAAPPPPPERVAVNPPPTPSQRPRGVPPPPPRRSRPAPPAPPPSASEIKGNEPAPFAAPVASGVTHLLIGSDYRLQEAAKQAFGEAKPAAKPGSGVTNLLIQSDYRLQEAAASLFGTPSAEPEATVPPSPAAPPPAAQSDVPAPKRALPKPAPPRPLRQPIYQSEPPPPVAAVPEPEAPKASPEPEAPKASPEPEAPKASPELEPPKASPEPEPANVAQASGEPQPVAKRRRRRNKAQATPAPANVGEAPPAGRGKRRRGRKR